MTFSKDGKIKNFINKFMINENDDEIESEDELKTIQIFTLQFYHCLIKDTLHAICIFVDLLTVCLSKYFSLSITFLNYRLSLPINFSH